MKYTLTTLTTFLIVSAGLAIGQTDTTQSKALWQPKVGQSWLYQVTVEVPEKSQLPTNVPGQKIEQLEGKQRATYPQTMQYKGEQVIDPKAEKPRKAHVFHVSNGKRLEEIQYMAFTEKGLEALGSKQEGVKPQEAMILSTPIPLVWKNWKGGEAFPVMLDHKVGGQKSRLIRKFKVIGWEELRTAAGKFHCLHVQSSGKNGPMEIKRSYWFSPGNGFVKEVRKYYVGEQLVMSQARVLTKIEE